MPRPTTKDDLLAQSKKNFEKLNTFVDSFSEEEQNTDFPEGTLNRNIKDVLMHLHHWHLMVLEWYEVGMKGEKPDIPAKGYNWRTIPALNREIQKKYSNVALHKSKDLFFGTHHEVQQLIKKHTNEELFERKKYPWTGNNAMGAYLIGAASSHYEWAYKLIRRCKK